MGFQDLPSEFSFPTKCNGKFFIKKKIKVHTSFIFSSHDHVYLFKYLHWLLQLLIYMTAFCTYDILSKYLSRSLWGRWGHRLHRQTTWVQNSVLPLNSTVTLYPSFLHADWLHQYVTTLVLVFLRYLLPILWKKQNIPSLNNPKIEHSWKLWKEDNILPQGT